ncbi:stalk domain-containing protein [Paenibacillus sp. GCM10027628]|uniref:stalk domain-containing protein n=1 Tax=Paenibacillus sp. GCM10027628 TaxID=3273413 RepID=UPI0036324619
MKGITRLLLISLLSAAYGSIVGTPAPVDAQTEIEEANPAVLIQLENESRIQAPIRTVVTTSPQTFRITFPEAMEHDSVEKTLQNQSISPQPDNAPELKWKFNWLGDKEVEVQVTATVGSSYPYRAGEYQLNVNKAKTFDGRELKQAPVFQATIQSPYQLWRYSADGKSRELLMEEDDLYSFSKLDQEDRYFLGTRPAEYCECDAVLKKLSAILDVQDKKLIRYPVQIQTTYRGSGDFVADRRGFFYTQPPADVKVPRSDSAQAIHVNGYVHGASFSKDHKQLFMAVGTEDQENNISIMIYNLDDKKLKVLADKLYGSLPVDQGFGRRMPVQFADDGECVYFVLNELDPYRELRYMYSKKEDRIQTWKPPVDESGWSGFLATDDSIYRYYYNAGLYRGERRTSGIDVISSPGVWLSGTHQMAFFEYNYSNKDNRQYTNNIQLLDADTLQHTAIYQGIYYDSQLIGSSKDGKWLYVNARAPLKGAPLQERRFGQGEDKLQGEVSTDTSATAVYINERKMLLKHPLHVEQTLYVPLREVLEAVNWRVDWVAESQKIMVRSTDSQTAELVLNDSHVVFNEMATALTYTPILIGDTTYLPAGTLQKLGFAVQWDDSKRVLFLQEIPSTGGITNDKGQRYEGELKQTIPSGVGMLFNAQGKLLYEGQFEAGQYHGRGKLYDEEGHLVYEGMFSHGTRTPGN